MLRAVERLAHVTHIEGRGDKGNGETLTTALRARVALSRRHGTATLQHHLSIGTRANALATPGSIGIFAADVGMQRLEPSGATCPGVLIARGGSDIVAARLYESHRVGGSILEPTPRTIA